jgi:hypothetical protein
MLFAGSGFAIERFAAHSLHEGGHVLASNCVTFTSEHVAQQSGTGKRVFQRELVDTAH